MIIPTLFSSAILKGSTTSLVGSGGVYTHTHTPDHTVCTHMHTHRAHIHALIHTYAYAYVCMPGEMWSTKLEELKHTCEREMWTTKLEELKHTCEREMWSTKLEEHTCAGEMWSTKLEELKHTCTRERLTFPLELIKKTDGETVKKVSYQWSRWCLSTLRVVIASSLQALYPRTLPSALGQATLPSHVGRK